MRLRLTEVLDYYDEPQLFVALDAVGTSYLCLVYDIDAEEHSLCIAASISRERLNDLVTGHIDLRNIFLEPELSLYDVVVDGNVIEATLRAESPSADMLPDEGYYLDFGKRENQDMVRASKEAGRTVIRLAFNYETNHHAIPWDVLTDALHYFQAIVANGYRRVVQSKNAEPATLSVCATLAASFDIELIANEPVDLFGRSKVADTLEMLSPLFGDEDEAVANCISSFKSTQKSYKNLLKTLTERDVSFKCKWVHESSTGIVNELPVTKERIQSLYSLASSLQTLKERNVVFEGSFYMADLRNGRWGLDLLNGEQRRGICMNGERLRGIVLHEVQYRVSCVEERSQNLSTGKVYYAYILTSIQRIV